MKRIPLFLLAAFTLGLVAASAVVFARPVPERVVIETDQAAGLVRFVIDGKRVAVIDKVGLHINGDVMYAGVLTDAGSGPGLWSGR